ncbi:uncharacterized protein [Argopecten irradians]|uniref:uncharacterized protein isoform X2 n=1 Tax=Argopecten irradians TaxID=31199 RepID=UPI003713DDC2
MKMGHRPQLLFCLISATLWPLMTGTVMLPPLTTEPLIQSTVISASSTCKSPGSTYSCNYCESRTDWPDHKDVLKDLDSSCSRSVGGDVPVPTDNGALFVDNDNNLCHYIYNITEPVTDTGYTLAFWLQYSGDAQSHLFRVNSDGLEFIVDVRQEGQVLTYFSGTSSISNSIPNLDMWNHIGMRFLDNSSEVYMNGHRLRDPVLESWFPPFKSMGAITFTSYNSIGNSSHFKILDFRFYVGALTEREMMYLYNSSALPDISSPPWDCRCPITLPRTLDNDWLKCTAGGPTEPRFLPTANLPLFAIDSDSDTSWVTDQTETAWVLLTMDKTYQVDGITIIVNNTVPSYVIIQFESPLTPGSSPINFSPASDNNNIIWSAENSLGSIENRQDLLKRLASSLNITLSGHADSSHVFSVVDIRVNRRKNCFGNADDLNGDECNCKISTNTNGSDCGQCEVGRYRGLSDLDCPFTCNCPSAPGILLPDQCNQDGGACHCKTNVEGYNCDTCKSLAYNLTAANPNGCMTCTSCDVKGSQRCDDTTGACVCKSNVAGAQCDRCSPDHYGLQDPGFEGCEPCDCSREGKNPNGPSQCNITTGQCQCKEYVTGRKCDQCIAGYKALDFSDSRGCSDCRCNKIGSQNITSCDQISGQCVCLYGVNNNLRCDPMFDTDSLEPAFGPIAGGTEVTLRGQFFRKNDSDSTLVKIFVDGEPQFLNVTRHEAKILVFVTNRRSSTGQFTIVVQWPKSVGFDEDDFSKKFPFTFRANPEVTEPMNATVFRSGGCFVKIRGRNFGSVQGVRMIAHAGNTEVLGQPCTNIGDVLINCPSPDLRNFTSLSTTSYGLQMDGMTMYRNLNGASLSLVNDPKVYINVDLTIDNVFTKNLVIKGSNLDQACTDNFEIKLGDDVCPIESMTSNEVTCSPVVTFPGDTKEAELKVIVGNFQSTVGIVKIKSFWVTWQFIVIAASLGGLIVIIILIVIIVKCCRRCQAEKFNDRKTSSLSQRTGQFDSIGPPIVAESTANPPRRNSYTDMSGVPLSDVQSEESIVEKFLQKLDSTLRDEVKSSLSKRSVIKLGLRCTQKGAEIRMIDGQYEEGPFIGQDATIKTIVGEFKDFGEDILPRWVGTGLAETLRFRDCFQENLHRSCGITVDQSRFYVLYPATQRILKEHLRDRKQEFTSFSLIEICQRIAEAMDYLSSNDIVHRDIATRNCVVCPGDVVKITDAAFSWSLFPDEYMYDSDRERWLPVRWMAQDSLQTGFYSSSTDVWSYGVLMWEVMSRGVLLPYFDIENNADIKDHVINGYRLGKPDIVPDGMYSLMMSCWDTNHSQRPAFVRIIERLIDILNPQESSTMIYQNEGLIQDEDLPEYGNIPSDRPKLPSRNNMPAKNGNVNFGYR